MQGPAFPYVVADSSAVPGAVALTELRRLKPWRWCSPSILLILTGFSSLSSRGNPIQRVKLFPVRSVELQNHPQPWAVLMVLWDLACLYSWPHWMQGLPWAPFLCTILPHLVGWSSEAKLTASTGSLTLIFTVSWGRASLWLWPMGSALKSIFFLFV